MIIRNPERDFSRDGLPERAAQSLPEKKPKLHLVEKPTEERPDAAKENIDLAGLYGQYQKEADNLFNQLQKKNKGRKWDKEDALYTQWLLTKGEVQQLEKIVSLNQELTKPQSENAKNFLLIEKETRLENLKAAEMEKRVVELWAEAKELVEDLLRAKNGTEQQTQAEEKLFNFIRTSSRDEKTLWQITAKFANESIVVDDAKKGQGLFGRLKNLFKGGDAAEKLYQTWTKYLEDYRPLTSKTIPPRPSRPKPPNFRIQGIAA